MTIARIKTNIGTNAVSQTETMTKSNFMSFQSVATIIFSQPNLVFPIGCGLHWADVAVFC
jgi:hypothetical protein